MSKLSHPRPNRKVTAAGLGGASAVIVLGTLGHFGVEIEYPGFEAAVATVFMFLIGYYVPERREEL